MMNVEMTIAALRRFESIDRWPDDDGNLDPIVPILEAAQYALEVVGAECLKWEEGICGGRLVDGLCGTHQPTEPIELPDPNEWMKEMQ